jgi:hypothetical protein
MGIMRIIKFRGQNTELRTQNKGGQRLVILNSES